MYISEYYGMIMLYHRGRETRRARAQGRGTLGMKTGKIERRVMTLRSKDRGLPTV